MKNNIKSIRKRRGLTQRELAKKLKISITYLNRIENDKKDPSLALAVRIAKVLEVTLNDIFLS